MEEVLPTLQQAHPPQGNEVAVATAAQVAKPNVITRLVTLYNEVVIEMKKVTWPDVGQIRQLSIGVIVLSLFGVMSSHLSSVLLWMLVALYLAFGILIVLYRVISRLE